LIQTFNGNASRPFHIKYLVNSFVEHAALYIMWLFIQFWVMYRLGVRLTVSLCENVTAATVFGVDFFRGIDQHKNLEPETLLGSYTLFFFVVVVVSGMSFQRGTPTIKEKKKKSSLFEAEWFSSLPGVMGL
jgi:hypothetical protein